jgi:DNA-binding MarR family transcriptional regulator
MASRAVTQAYDVVLQPSGLRATQFTVLAKLAVAGETSLGDLAKRMVMDRTTLTRNLRPLERDGLIRSEVGQDRRSRALMLTAKGKTALDRALPLWRRAQDRMVQSLGGPRWRRLLDDLLEASGPTG